MSRRLSSAGAEAGQGARHPAPARQSLGRATAGVQGEAVAAPGAALQGVIGNQALSRRIQPKLAVSTPDDPSEREADRIADQVLRRKATPCHCGGVCSSCRGPKIFHRQAGDGGGAPAAPDGLLAGLGAGRPMDAASRTFFEPRFGRDLSGVRIHTGGPAAEAARSVNAHAFTLGRDIVFGASRYAPESEAGRRLLGHELTHVLQQAPSLGSGGGLEVRREAAPEAPVPSHEPLHIARQGPRGASPSSVSLVELSCGSNSIIFHTDAGDFSYHLSECDLTDGDYTAGVAVSGSNVTFNLGTAAAEGRRFHFGYDIAPGQPNPAAFFRGQASVRIVARAGDLDATEGMGGLVTIPTDVSFALVGPGAPALGGGGGEFGLWPSVGRSTTIGGARGLGFLISPPIRGWYDPFLPLGTRLGAAEGTLGLSGGRWALERYLPTSPELDIFRPDISGHLRPRYGVEGSELRLLEYTGRPTPWSSVGLTSRDLERIPDIVARLSSGGTESLSAADQALLQTFIRAHAEGGITFASPAMSATAQPGLSSLEGVFPFIREAPYVVRIEVPASAAADVNSALGAERSATLVREIEVLVTTDARGAVTGIRPNPTSALGGSVGYLRWGGRALIVVGIGISAYRIGTATREELPRVIGEEAGGWAGGFAGAALVGAGCVALGVATGGVALLLCGLAGGIAGGIGGSALGGAIGEDIGRGGGSTTLRGFDSPMFNCFTADTPVLLADGTTTPIGQVAVGDRILSWHETSEKVMEGTVVKVFARPPQPFVEIELEEGPPIGVTAYHHLWVNRGGRDGWMEAGALRPGDELFAPVGTPARLAPRKVRSVTPRPAGPAVYDLSVEPTHTYFAGGILAHNKLP